ncbi:MAG TPA: SDR family NAD(P)-dependent oxidoreductase [Cyclobacteriaceae bacterium]
MSFKNKTAIVTGAGQGIGFEICRQLAHEGTHVILNDIDISYAEGAARRINKETSGRCKAISGDSSNISFIKEMVDEAVKQTGELNIGSA